MSIWSRIGLVDKNMFYELQKEIFELREENVRLSQERANDLVECVENKTKEIQDSICSAQKSITSLKGTVSEVALDNSSIRKELLTELSNEKKKVNQCISEKAETLRKTLDLNMCKLLENGDRLEKQSDKIENELGQISLKMEENREEQLEVCENTKCVLQQGIASLSAESVRVLHEQTDELVKCMGNKAEKIQDSVCQAEKNITSLEKKATEIVPEISSNAKEVIRELGNIDAGLKDYFTDEMEILKEFMDSANCKLIGANERLEKQSDEIEGELQQISCQIEKNHEQQCAFFDSTKDLLQQELFTISTENIRLLQEQTNELANCMDNQAEVLRDGVCQVEEEILTELKNEKGKLSRFVSEQTDMIMERMDSNSRNFITETEKLENQSKEIQKEIQRIVLEVGKINERSSELFIKVKNQNELIYKNNEQLKIILNFTQMISDVQEKSSENLNQLNDINRVLEGMEMMIEGNEKKMELNQKNMNIILENMILMKRDIDNLTLKTEEDTNELSAIGKFLGALWESMKLVWVNSILDNE